jgi:transcriptional regulator with XRE-family HTH domain
MKRKQPSIIDQLRGTTLERGGTQLEIAAKTGINQGNLSKFLRGERSLSLENAAALCAYLDLHLVRSRRPRKAK